MLYIDSIWEYIVNFLELALFIIFIHKKLRIRANYKHQAVLMFLFVSFQFAVLCTLNKMGIRKAPKDTANYTITKEQYCISNVQNTR